MRRIVAVLGLAGPLLTLAACSSSGGAGTGLISGTVDNSVAKDISEGGSAKDAMSIVNGKPLRTLPDPSGTGPQCDQYRGVNVRGITEIKVTGVVWTFCLQLGKVTRIAVDCPNPWKPGEFERYKKAGYSADPSDCAR